MSTAVSKWNSLFVSAKKTVRKRPRVLSSIHNAFKPPTQTSQTIPPLPVNPSLDASGGEDLLSTPPAAAQPEVPSSDEPTITLEPDFNTIEGEPDILIHQEGVSEEELILTGDGQVSTQIESC